MAAHDYFCWLKSDEIVGHAWGVLLDHAEMARMMRCRCQFPHLNENSLCDLCGRTFVFRKLIKPIPPE